MPERKAVEDAMQERPLTLAERIAHIEDYLTNHINTRLSNIDGKIYGLYFLTGACFSAIVAVLLRA